MGLALLRLLVLAYGVLAVASLGIAVAAYVHYYSASPPPTLALALQPGVLLSVTGQAAAQRQAFVATYNDWYVRYWTLTVAYTAVLVVQLAIGTVCVALFLRSRLFGFWLTMDSLALVSVVIVNVVPLAEDRQVLVALARANNATPLQQPVAVPPQLLPGDVTAWRLFAEVWPLVFHSLALALAVVTLLVLSRRP
jgi:hypothetical protein